MLREKNALEREQYTKKYGLNLVVPIKGGRYEADLIELTKRPIYWSEDKPSRIRRGLWFYKEMNEQRFVPYEEEYSLFLEAEYEKTVKNNTFHKRIDYAKHLSEATISATTTTTSEPQKIASTSTETRQSVKSQRSLSYEEAFVFHSPSIMLHFTQASMLDEFGNLNSDAKRPHIVKRGVDEVVDKFEPDETEKIDHLCFVVHGKAFAFFIFIIFSQLSQ
jgi:hypothetical protein